MVGFYSFAAQTTSVRKNWRKEILFGCLLQCVCIAVYMYAFFCPHFSSHIGMYVYLFIYIYIYICSIYTQIRHVYVCKHIKFGGSTYPENGQIHVVRMVKPSRCWARHRDRARGHLKQPGFCLVVEFHPLIQETPQKENSWWFKDFMISFASGYDPNVFTNKTYFQTGWNHQLVLNKANQ